jgi:hypothetical protein
MLSVSYTVKLVAKILVFHKLLDDARPQKSDCDNQQQSIEPILRVSIRVECRMLYPCEDAWKNAHISHALSKVCWGIRLTSPTCLPKSLSQRDTVGNLCYSERPTRTGSVHACEILPQNLQGRIRSTSKRGKRKLNVAELVGKDRRLSRVKIVSTRWQVEQ